MEHETKNVEYCTCNSNSFFVKNGVMHCSYCKKPEKKPVKFSDLKPLTNKEAEDFLREKMKIQHTKKKRTCFDTYKLIMLKVQRAHCLIARRAEAKRKA